MDDPVDQTPEGLNVVWMFVCCVLVILMQAGFAAYEVGSIHRTSTEHILLKNIGDAAIAFAAWCATGYAIANGSTFFFLVGAPSSAEDVLSCIFGWAFSATCITIMSGAVADRVPVKAYYIYALLTAMFFYPTVAYTAWGDGLFDARRNDPVFGCGSGVVHMFGGLLSLVLAWWYGPRDGRLFAADASHEEVHRNRRNHTKVGQINEKDFRRNDPTWMTVGAFLLWLGWYGFNCGSTGGISTSANQNAVGRAAINTTIGAAFGAAASVAFELLYHIWSPKYRQDEHEIQDPLHDEEERQDPKEWETRRDWNIIRKHQEEHESNEWRWLRLSCVWSYSTHKNLHGAISNGILAGLVSITAGCATMSYGWAIGATFIGVGIYHLSYRSIICCCKIDDAVGASAIHGFVGFWGLVAASFTADGDTMRENTSNSVRIDAGYPSNNSCSTSEQLTANLVFGLLILFWVAVTGLVIVVVLTKFCADADSNPKICGKDGWLHTARKNQQRVPEPNPEVEKVKLAMKNRYDQLRNRVQDIENRDRTTLEQLQSDVSNLERIIKGTDWRVKHDMFASDVADDRRSL